MSFPLIFVLAGFVIVLAVVAAAMFLGWRALQSHMAQLQEASLQDRLALQEAALAERSQLEAAAVAERETAVQSAIAAATAERDEIRRELDVHRERTVSSTVSTATQLVGAELEAKMKAGSKELDLRNQSFGEKVSSIEGALEKMGEMVGQLSERQAKQYGAVASRLEETARNTAQLESTTANLREALASSKQRGNWGERMAEDVLRSAGFVDGVNYRTQTQVEGGGIPDFTFMLPQERVVHMDVKFPIDNYLKFLDAEAAGDVRAADDCRAQFAKDVRARIKEIGTRNYIDSSTTIDQVLLFIPNESVYGFLHDNDAGLLDWALGRKVVLCSPFTLFSVLAIIRQSMDQFMVEQTSGEILQVLGEFKKQWGMFNGELVKVEKHFETTQNALERLGGVRRRAMERQLDKIDDLQASASAAAPAVASTDATTGDDDWGSLREVG